MSEVVSFRLDRENPREARALLVLKAWGEAGYSTRHILTEALLRLDGGGDEALAATVEELRAALEAAQDVLEHLREGRYAPPPGQADGHEQLTAGFIASVRKAARPGLAHEGERP